MILEGAKTQKSVFIVYYEFLACVVVLWWQSSCMVRKGRGLWHFADFQP
jgi:hypothetical protein